MRVNKLRAVDIIKGTVTFSDVERPLVREYIQQWDNSMPDDPVLGKFDILVHFPIVEVLGGGVYQDGIKIQWGNSPHKYNLYSIAEIRTHITKSKGYKVT